MALMSRKDFLHFRFITDNSRLSVNSQDSVQETREMDIGLPPEFNSFLFQEAEHLGINMDNEKEAIEKKMLQALWTQI